MLSDGKAAKLGGLSIWALKKFPMSFPQSSMMKNSLALLYCE